MWLYNGKELTEDDIDGIGFVYVITNTVNGRKYIGKKLFKKAKTKVVKGKKKRLKVDSDWKDYYGSNKTLIEEVIRLGKENFKREILRICTTKAECSYFELKYQIQFEVLESDAYYNDWIYVRVRKEHLRKIF